LIDPDELKSSSKFPISIAAIENAGLEAFTGADFAISQLPIRVVKETLQMHIDNKSLFVQRKHGYDMLSFDNLKSSIARMKQCDIPQQQCILLFIGKDEPQTMQDINTDKIMINGQEPYGDTTYKTFLKVKALWRYRGGVVDWLPYPEALGHWIEAQTEALEKIQDEGKREIYNTQMPIWNDDIWQEIEEVKKDDWRYTLVAGLDGFGPKLATNVRQYLVDEGYGSTLYTALKVLTDLDEKGKPVHNIKGWGKKSREKLRLMLDLIPGYNLYASDINDFGDSGASHMRGVEAGISFIEHGIIKLKLPGSKAIENAQKMAEAYKDGRWLE
jgi:hypothetical protein